MPISNNPYTPLKKYIGHEWIDQLTQVSEGSCSLATLQPAYTLLYLRYHSYGGCRNVREQRDGWWWCTLADHGCIWAGYSLVPSKEGGEILPGVKSNAKWHLRCHHEVTLKYIFVSLHLHKDIELLYTIIPTFYSQINFCTLRCTTYVQPQCILLLIYVIFLAAGTCGMSWSCLVLGIRKIEKQILILLAEELLTKASWVYPSLDGWKCQLFLFECKPPIKWVLSNDCTSLLSIHLYCVQMKEMVWQMRT